MALAMGLLRIRVTLLRPEQRITREVGEILVRLGYLSRSLDILVTMRPAQRLWIQPDGNWDSVRANCWDEVGTEPATSNLSAGLFDPVAPSPRVAPWGQQSMEGGATCTSTTLASPTASNMASLIALTIEIVAPRSTEGSSSARTSSRRDRAAQRPRTTTASFRGEVKAPSSA